MQMIIAFVGLVVALVGVIYKLFSGTIDLKIDLKIALLRQELGLDAKNSKHKNNDP